MKKTRSTKYELLNNIKILIINYQNFSNFDIPRSRRGEAEGGRISDLSQ